MESTASHPRLSRQRLASPPRCKNARSRCRPLQNHKRSLHRNQQYSITALTDASGAIIERYAYTACGTPTITDASGTTRTTTAVGNRYTYTGREWDETLALYHYRARMYDSVAGRFVSRDPIGYEGSPYLLYAYLSQTPLFLTDPMGLESPWGPTGAAGNAGRPHYPYTPGQPTVLLVHPALPPIIPVDPEKVPRKLSKYRTKDVTYVASLEVSCDGMKVTSAYLEGITNAVFAEITIEDPAIKFETHSDCVNDRLVVSHVGYVYAVMKKRVGIGVSVGSTGGGAGGTADSQIIKFPVYSGPLDCGPCDCDE